MRWALAACWYSAPEAGSLWSPLQSSLLGEARKTVFGLLAVPDSLTPGLPAPGLGLPRLRTAMLGLGAGAPPSSPAHWLPPSLPPRPKPFPASAVLAPHCRCPRLPMLGGSHGALRSSRSLEGWLLLLGTLVSLDSLSSAPEAATPTRQRGPRRTAAVLDPGVLLDAAGQADRLPETRGEMPEATEWWRRWRGHHPEQCAQEAQLHFADRAPAALHPGAG